jgi:hypothetical protein
MADQIGEIFQHSDSDIEYESDSDDDIPLRELIEDMVPLQDVLDEMPLCQLISKIFFICFSSMMLIIFTYPK